jgi:hypothetical protein
MRALVLTGVLLSAPHSHAQPAHAVPWVSGAQLLELLTVPAGVPNALSMTPKQYLDAERARLYVEGVHDRALATGPKWCPNAQYPPKPDVMHEAVLIGLRKLPPDQLRRSAADLVIEIWSARWPCAHARGAR